MQRETRLVTTKNGYNVEVKTWLNQDEDRKVKEFYDAHSTTSVREGVKPEDATEDDIEVTVDLVSSSVKIVSFQELLFDVWVHTVNGATNSQEVRKSMRNEDFQEVVGDIISHNNEDKKKESETVTNTGEVSSQVDQEITAESSQ